MWWHVEEFFNAHLKEKKKKDSSFGTERALGSAAASALLLQACLLWQHTSGILPSMMHRGNHCWLANSTHKCGGSWFCTLSSPAKANRRGPKYIHLTWKASLSPREAGQKRLNHIQYHGVPRNVKEDFLDLRKIHLAPTVTQMWENKTKYLKTVISRDNDPRKL